METMLVIFVGAGTGGVVRWFLQSWLGGLWGDFPLGTLVVNLLGGFLAGVLMTKGQLAPPWVMPLLMTGFLGGLTTFSAFSAETIQMLLSGEISKGFAYVGLSVILSIAFCGVGFIVGSR